MTVFLLQHLRSEADSEDLKLVGIYSTRQEAEAAVERKRKFPGFQNFPRIVDPLTDEDESGFYINEIELNVDCWSEGFLYESEEPENEK